MNVILAASRMRTAGLLSVVHTAGGYKYHCFAAPGSAMSSAVWKVTRESLDGTEVVPAGTGGFDHVATSAAVASLPYHLGS